MNGMHTDFCRKTSEVETSMDNKEDIKFQLDLEYRAHTLTERLSVRLWPFLWSSARDSQNTFRSNIDTFQVHATLRNI